MTSLATGRWPRLTGAVLRADLLAGLAVGLLVVPQALAYAGLAGLPPVHGLYCALLPAVVGALFGWCHQLHTGPVAMTAMLVAATLAPLAEPGSAAYLELAILLAALVGAVRIALGLLRASLLTRLVSSPVLTGFTAAAALVIAGTQLPALLGVERPAGGGGSLAGIIHAIGGLAAPHPPALAMGLGCAAALLALRRWRPRWPGALLVAGAATLLSWTTGYTGAVVGAVPAGLPSPTLPAFTAERIRDLLPGACMVALIGFAEVLTVAKACAARTRQRIDLDRELVGQGAASLAAAATGAFPPSGSLSRSALNLAAGARTAASSLAAAAVVAAVLLGGTACIAPLPQAALAALVVVSVLPLVDLGALGRAWQAHRHDGIAAIAALVLTLALAPRLIEGFLASIAIAVGLFLWRMMRPRVADCARHPDGTWRDWRTHGLAASPELAVLRPDGRITFASAAAVEDAVHAAIAERPGLRAIVLHCEGVNELDATGCETLRGLSLRLGEAGIALAFSALKAPVEAVAARTGVLTPDGPRFRTADEAVNALAARLGLPPQPWDPPTGP